MFPFPDFSYLVSIELLFSFTAHSISRCTSQHHSLTYYYIAALCFFFHASHLSFHTHLLHFYYSCVLAWPCFIYKHQNPEVKCFRVSESSPEVLATLAGKYGNGARVNLFWLRDLSRVEVMCLARR